MKIKLFLMIAVAAIAFAVCSIFLFNEGSESTTTDPPPYAASNKIWTFGDQVWSDAIRMPECDKQNFPKGGSFQESCRSYTADGHTWFYYDWHNVRVNAAKMCPSPWRVPTSSDFDLLVKSATGAELVDRWGLGGMAGPEGIAKVSELATYWTISADNAHLAVFFAYTREDRGLEYFTTAAGFQVRCVK